MLSAKQKLQSVLEYTEKLLSLNERIVFNIQQSSIVTFYESELSGREGIELRKEGDTWVILQRLRETKPPKLPETISEWIKDETKPSPTKPPVLLNERCVRLSELT